MHRNQLAATRITAALVLALLAASPLNAQQFKEPDESELQSHNHYINRFGETVHSPAKTKTNEVPEGAAAQCRDGAYSFATTAAAPAPGTTASPSGFAD